MATRKLKQIYYSDKTEGTIHKRQNYILDKIKHKLTTNNAIIAQADKGKTIVIIYQRDYNEKVHNFIKENNIQLISKNPINRDIKIIREPIQQCNLIFHKNQMKHLTQKKPRTTKIKRTNKNT